MQCTSGFVIFLLCGLNLTKCADILGIFPTPGRSQFILGEKLMSTLAENGHNVTVISPFLPANKIANYQTVQIEMFNMGTVDLWAMNNLNDFDNAKGVLELWTAMSNNLVSQQQIHDFIDSNSTFDLVILENFGTEALMGFAKHFNAPLIVFSSLGMSEWSNNYIGNVRLPSISSFTVAKRTNKMTFLQRTINTLLTIYDTFYKELVYFPNQQKIMDKYFGGGMNLKETMNNVTFLLLNSHPLTTEPSLLTSAAVEIGGFHITTKKLPGEIQKLLDESKEGVVLFSMGSNLEANNLSNKTIEHLIKAIRKLPQKVLWKCNLKEIPNKPENLFLSSWLPQSDILAHPNTVAFVTHSGLLSTTEAIYHGVPMVAIPVFGDQHMNALRAVEKGIAVLLEISALNEDSFYGAVEEVISNQRYKETSKKISEMFRDRAVKPLDLAVHTIEYALRYKPMEYFRSPALDLYWYQLYLLDILLFAVVIYVILKKIIVRDTRNKKMKIA